jgi:hypothetical protein
MLQQLEFLACVTGGADATQFGVLLGNLDVLALATSGVDPDDYWDAFAISFDQFDATEVSRAGDEARVNVRLKMKIDPDIARLRQMMRASQKDRGRPIDDTAIEALVDRLIGPLRLDRIVQEEVTVSRLGGAWQFCAPGAR